MRIRQQDSSTNEINLYLRKMSISLLFLTHPEVIEVKIKPWFIYFSSKIKQNFHTPFRLAFFTLSFQRAYLGLSVC